jgi:SNF2 family DNA or RNA helicase
LDRERLRNAECILSTYETVRDYQHSFGAVQFSVIIFDEVQKIKTPGTLITEAAKALHSEFSLAVTGTPIENRLADLWCIMDTVRPGLLGDLKSFSRTYEVQEDRTNLRELKQNLTRSGDGEPAVMLRRMKVDRLDGLPEKHEHDIDVPMPEI